MGLGAACRPRRASASSFGLTEAQVVGEGQHAGNMGEGGG